MLREDRLASSGKQSYDWASFLCEYHSVFRCCSCEGVELTASIGTVGQISR